MQARIIELGLILDDRLQYNQYWRKVDLKVRGSYLEIRWFSPRNKSKRFDPKGKREFKLTRVAPLSLKAVNEEIKRQKQKLRRDKNG